MPLPAWMPSHLNPAHAPAPAPGVPADMWKGKPLRNREIVYDAELNFRIYNDVTGELLSFGSGGGPGTLNGFAQEVLRVQAENPGVKLRARQFDGPVY